MGEVYDKQSLEACSEGQFHVACSQGQMDVIDALLQSGVDVNEFFDKDLPLHCACRQTEPWAVDVVTKLITSGADVDLEDKHGMNALEHVLYAIPFQPHIAQLVLDCSKKGINKLDSYYGNYFWATRSNKARKFLVENGININHVANNQTYLDRACTYEIEYLRSVGGKLYSEL